MWPNFAHPHYLDLLPIAALAVAGLLALSYLVRQSARKAWGDPKLAAAYSKQQKPWGSLVHGAIWVSLAALLVVAIAEPMTPEAPWTVAAGQLKIITVSDVSWSMQTEDYRGLMPGSPQGSSVATGASGSRLQMARYLIEQIMLTAPGNKMTAVTYMGEGWPLVSRLLTDYSGLRIILDNGLLPGNAPGGGSDPAAGLAKALDVFAVDAKLNAKDPSDANMRKVIVLFSDGGIPNGSPEETQKFQESLQKVLAAINEQHIHLIVVGLGSNTEQNIPMYDPQSGAFLQNRKIDPKETTAINQEFLKGLANAATAGEYHYVAPGQTTLNIQWARALGGSRIEPISKPLFQWVGGAAFALLIIVCFPSLRRKRTVK